MLPDTIGDDHGAKYSELPAGGNGDRNARAFQDACIFILVIELVERLCYYTFAGSQEFFLEQLGYSVQQSAGLNSAFTTLCYLWPLVGGYMADTFWGRYKTIVCFASAYLVGTLICSLGALPGDLRSPSAYLLGAMGLIALGSGGIKPNISNFGADQYDVTTEDGRKAQEVFYTQFYVVINVGALASFGFMTTLCSDGGPFVPRAFGYSAAYGLGTIFMALALVAFICKSASYRHKPPGGNLLRGLASHLASAARRGSVRAAAVCAGVPAMLVGVLLTVVFSFRPRRATLLTALFANIFGLVAVGWGCSGDLAWARSLARPDRGLSRQDTADFLRVMPTLISASLAFNAVYNCNTYWFQQQACQMDVRLGNAQLSGSFFNVADCMAIVAFTPVILSTINPALSRCLGGLSRHGKLLIGYCLSVISVLWAAYLEVRRRNSSLLPVESECAPGGIHMSDISAWWMVGPYAVMGLAEVYVNPTLYFLSYSQAPLRLRSIAQAVCLLMGAVSSGLFTLLTHAMGSANDLNDSHLEYGYYASIALSVPFLLCYLVVQGSLAEKEFLFVRDDSEDEDEGPFKEVAYMRLGFFKDFPSPVGSLLGSPASSAAHSPASSPSPRTELLADSHGDFMLVAEHQD